MKLTKIVTDTINFLMGVRFEEEEEQDTTDRCLHYRTHRCNDISCSGYSSAIICDDYINKKHLDQFKKYHL